MESGPPSRWMNLRFGLTWTRWRTGHARAARASMPSCSLARFWRLARGERRYFGVIASNSRQWENEAWTLYAWTNGCGPLDSSRPVDWQRGPVALAESQTTGNWRRQRATCALATS